MAFDMFKTHKLADQLESEAYEHCEWAIKSFYDLELEENEYGYEQTYMKFSIQNRLPR